MSEVLTTRAGEAIGVGDRVATRRNDRDLGVANRDTWTVTAVAADGSLVVTGRPGRPHPARRPTSREHVELAYATTVYGAQGETVDRAHLARRGDHRRRRRLRRHDPRPRTPTPPTSSPTASRTPARSGSRCSAATAPTSDPPTPPPSPPRTSTATDHRHQPARAPSQAGSPQPAAPAEPAAASQGPDPRPTPPAPDRAGRHRLLTVALQPPGDHRRPGH